MTRKSHLSIQTMTLFCTKEYTPLKVVRYSGQIILLLPAIQATAVWEEKYEMWKKSKLLCIQYMREHEREMDTRSHWSLSWSGSASSRSGRNSLLIRAKTNHLLGPSCWRPWYCEVNNMRMWRLTFTDGWSISPECQCTTTVDGKSVVCPLKLCTDALAQWNLPITVLNMLQDSPLPPSVHSFRGAVVS